MKLCINCVHCIRANYLGFSHCGKFTTTKPDPVTGGEYTESPYCATARELEHMCGMEAIHYQEYNQH